MKYSIAHLSDIHVGEGKAYREKINKCVKEVNDLNPDLVVITGDLTNEGLLSEFIEAEELLKNFKSKTVYLMGNHDARNVGYLHFEDFFGAPITEIENQYIRLLAMDSSEPDLDVGKIGREYYNKIKEFYERSSSQDQLKIFAIHHHLLPVPLSGRERDIVMDAGDVLKMLIKYDVSITLCGHKHVPYVWQIENMVVVNTGTVGSPRTRGINRQGYTIIEYDENKIDIYFKIIDGEKKPLALFERTSENKLRRIKFETV
ncbi:MAG: metallophosphoesterase family protein [Candidatus Odinarchaeia archaeon]